MLIRHNPSKHLHPAVHRKPPEEPADDGENTEEITETAPLNTGRMARMNRSIRA